MPPTSALSICQIRYQQESNKNNLSKKNKIPKVKFLNQVEVKGLTQMLADNISESTPTTLKEFKKKNPDDYYAVLMGYDELIYCSKLEIDKLELWIPEPNPVHIYYTEAYVYLDPLLKSQKDLVSIATQLKGSTNIETFPYLLKFFAQSSKLIVFAFLTLESFINQVTPEDFEFKTKKKILDKAKIERYLKFGDKIGLLMPKIFSKNFAEDYPVENGQISKLKELRDDLTHLKTKKDKYNNKYREVINSILNSDYEAIMSAVETYLNYYVPDFIEYSTIKNN